MNEQTVDFLVSPLTPSVGGLVSGLDLSKPLSQRAVERLRAALAERHVLFFENQTLDPHAQRDFAARFGDLHVHPIFPHVEGVPEITSIETRPDYLPDNDNWHTDVTFVQTPPFGAVLTPRILPPSGGDTLWSSTVAAFLALSEPLRRLLDGLTAEHSFEKSFHAIAGVSARRLRSGRKRLRRIRLSFTQLLGRSKEPVADYSSIPASRRAYSNSLPRRATPCWRSYSNTWPSLSSRFGGVGNSATSRFGTIASARTTRLWTSCRIRA
jgi:Taurine catabolism dioxygenase TauD, TfdA family